jgi:glycosyltransferase involved in cell wall biosynthesis
MVSNDNYPKFTVFIPVKNGKSYISLCVESILAQTYKNFDLVILGGYSTDGTCEWLQTLEERDSRIKVILSDNELGIEANWDRILKTKKNEFMTIVGYDDLFDPDFLEVINETIMAEPDSDLYLAHFRLIDHEGKMIRNCTPIPKYETAADFLAARWGGARDSFGTGYVMRSAVYDEIGGIQNYPDLLYADDALWMSLMSNKPKITSHRVCFSYRYHLGSVSGSANLKSVFIGLKKYYGFLIEMGKKNDELNYVVRLYGPAHALQRCQMYYCYLYLNKAALGAEFNQEIMAIRSFLEEVAAGGALVENCAHLFGRLKLRLRSWIGKFVRSVVR